MTRYIFIHSPSFCWHRSVDVAVVAVAVAVVVASDVTQDAV